MQLVSPSWANLVEKLAVLSQQQSTGELILSSGDDRWHLYLLFGRLLYATGGSHRVRRWHRALKQYCPGFKSDVYHHQLNEHEPWECQLLTFGINQNQLSLTQAKSVISSSVHEVLFALVGRAELSSHWLPKKQRPIALLEVKECLSNAQQVWQEWLKMGLGQLFPDQTPVLKQSLSEINLGAFEPSLSLLQQVNGTHTIWDIALQVKQPVTAVASGLQRLANQGVLELQTVPDFPAPMERGGAESRRFAAEGSRGEREKTMSPLTPSPLLPLSTNELAKQIQACAQEQFTGRLDIENSQVQEWSLYFHGGDLIGCASSVHPIRRWCRQMYAHCPELAVDVGTRESDGTRCWDYDSLAELVRQGKILLRQMAAVVEGLIAEILFDIQQQSEQLPSRSELQLTYKRIPGDTIYSTDSTLVLIQAEQAWQQAMQAWEAWQRAGLVEYSPNQAPAIWQPEELRQQTSPIAYQNLTTLADGNRTLRDLAVKLKQNLLPLTQSIMPYINQGIVRLVEVGDVETPFHNVSLHAVRPVTPTHPKTEPVTQPANPVQTKPTSPMVVYIDDSQSDTQTMSTILNQAGYRFISVQEPVKALPILLEHKPDLIFLDLVMPVANGYEICAQIRRVSILKETPVIILTSNDGIVDRVRAKMVGSSGFLGKPINQEKVLRILHRYLLTPTVVRSETLDTFGF